MITARELFIRIKELLNEHGQFLFKPQEVVFLENFYKKNVNLYYGPGLPPDSVLGELIKWVIKCSANSWAQRKLENYLELSIHNKHFMNLAIAIDGMKVDFLATIYRNADLFKELYACINSWDKNHQLHILKQISAQEDCINYLQNALILIRFEQRVQNTYKPDLKKCIFLCQYSSEHLLPKCNRELELILRLITKISGGDSAAYCKENLAYYGVQYVLQSVPGDRVTTLLLLQQCCTLLEETEQEYYLNQDGRSTFHESLINFLSMWSSVLQGSKLSVDSTHEKLSCLLRTFEQLPVPPTNNQEANLLLMLVEHMFKLTKGDWALLRKYPSIEAINHTLINCLVKKYPGEYTQFCKIVPDYKLHEPIQLEWFLKDYDVLKQYEDRIRFFVKGMQETHVKECGNYEFMNELH